MRDEAVALIERGVDVSASTTYGATALTLAVTGDHNESVELLLNYGADPRQLIDVSVVVKDYICYFVLLTCTFY
jgi:ankyrin repeat protein